MGENAMFFSSFIDLNQGKAIFQEIQRVYEYGIRFRK